MEKSTSKVVNKWKNMQKADGHILCKQVRLLLNLNQYEFGKLLGFGTPTSRISEIENNRVRLSNQVKQSIGFLYMASQLDETIVKEIVH